MKDGDRVGNFTCRHEGYDFLREIERAPVAREDRRGAAHAPRRAVLAEQEERRGLEPQDGRRHLDVGARGHRRHQRLDERRRRQRRVALKVHHKVHVAQGAQRRRAALGPVAAGVRRHHDLTAEAAHRLGDPVVIGRHDHAGDPAHRLRRLPAALDQRLGPVGPRRTTSGLPG
jgi:hypothetical protein